jgi:cyclic-di-AMP phosphodiesterase PgpH
MNDRSSALENYDELKFSREQGFFDRNLAIRILIGAIFTLALFLFLHFREVRVEMLELNSVAPGYIVAQVDFDFLDDEATSILRQEAVSDIGKIYKISDKEIRQRRMEFENFLIYNQEWRKYVEDSTFEEMFRGIDSLEKVMLQLRFTDPRTLQHMREMELPTTNYLIYTPPDLSEGVHLPAQVWKYLRDTALPAKTFNDGTVKFVTGFFQKNTWIIEDDIPDQRLLRKRIQSSVPDKYTHISAGSRIIDQGDRVTARHIAMLQAMKQALSDSRNLWHPVTLLGSLILALLLTGICVVYFRSNHPQILSSNRKLALLVTIAVLTFAIAKTTEFLLLNSNSNAMELVRYPVIVAFPAILLASLMNTRVATFASGFLTVVLMMTLAFERQGFMVINLAAALIAILSARSLRRRKEIFVICAKAWVCCVLVIFALSFSQNIFWNTSILADIISTGVCLLLTAVAVVGLLPLLESTFRVMTDVTLTEYMDPNNDLLRRLTIEAPGTYQHSVVVGNIAETAALAIGANGLFCRVATLYHDIGKMITPQYFTENQQGGMDVHQLLTPRESAEVIIAHVSEGVAMARKAGLPEQFIDIIKEHHGTSLVYYFYRKELERVGGDKTKVNEADFRYAGPKPRSKESAIIMLADTLEAASRSLEKINESSLSELATRLVREKIDDRQFDECLLTLEELSTVVNTLVKTLVAFGHSRIKYPSREVRKDRPNDATPRNAEV